MYSSARNARRQIELFRIDDASCVAMSVFVREGGGAWRLVCFRRGVWGRKGWASFVLVEVSVEVPRLVVREMELQHSGFGSAASRVKLLWDFGWEEEGRIGRRTDGRDDHPYESGGADRRDPEKGTAKGTGESEENVSRG